MDNFLDEMLGGEGNAEGRARFRGLWDVRTAPLPSWFSGIWSSRAKRL